MDISKNNVIAACSRLLPMRKPRNLDQLRNLRAVCDILNMEKEASECLRVECQIYNLLSELETLTLKLQLQLREVTGA